MRHELFRDVQLFGAIISALTALTGVDPWWMFGGGLFWAALHHYLHVRGGLSQGESPGGEK